VNFRSQSFEQGDGLSFGLSVQQCEVGVHERISEVVKKILIGSDQNNRGFLTVTHIVPLRGEEIVSR